VTSTISRVDENFISIRWTKNKANFFHCLHITFIQNINLQYLLGPLCLMHSSSYMLHHLGKLIQIWCWCILPTQYELILIIIRSTVFNGMVKIHLIEIKFSSTRFIVDVTKLPFQKPKHQVAQWSTYSTYKTETQ
jgi:hypothetical protein